MDISIDERWEGFVRDAVDEGRFASADKVVQAGLHLLEQYETKQQALRETLAAAIARGGSHTDEEIGAYLATWLDRRRAAQAAE